MAQRSTPRPPRLGRHTHFDDSVFLLFLGGPYFLAFRGGWSGFRRLTLHPRRLQIPPAEHASGRVGIDHSAVSNAPIVRTEFHIHGLVSVTGWEPGLRATGVSAPLRIPLLSAPYHFLWKTICAFFAEYDWFFF